MATQPAGDIAFVGPAHLSYLSDYQYVEVVSVEEASVHVSIAGPDATSGGSMYTMPLGTFQHRVVPARERDLWPGSYLAHPVAFVWTTDDGVDVWSYGVVSGCSATDDETTLHIVGHEGPVRLPLVATTAIIKADVLTYALQIGGTVNAAAFTPTELLEQQNSALVACNRRRPGRPGLPTAITELLTIPFVGKDIVPLVRPATLQLVRVRREQILA
ncbi:hypothetical protein PF008_g27212 [Phytophthora fragariae]|uniref:Uncharacterized protein n=1 Tax=Phytophthora fragariae TaxID=53985 RepID=A0A6G0QET3_9STRA|nr:hypothetical protein PF008_g27212 [Phytophthora fragariae]